MRMRRKVRRMSGKVIVSGVVSGVPVHRGPHRRPEYRHHASPIAYSTSNYSTLHKQRSRSVSLYSIARNDLDTLPLLLRRKPCADALQLAVVLLVLLDLALHVCLAHRRCR